VLDHQGFLYGFGEVFITEVDSFDLPEAGATTAVATSMDPSYIGVIVGHRVMPLAFDSCCSSDEAGSSCFVEAPLDLASGNSDSCHPSGCTFVEAEAAGRMMVVHPATPSHPYWGQDRIDFQIDYESMLDSRTDLVASFD